MLPLAAAPSRLPSPHRQAAPVPLLRPRLGPVSPFFLPSSATSTPPLIHPNSPHPTPFSCPPRPSLPPPLLRRPYRLSPAGILRCAAAPASSRPLPAANLRYLLHANTRPPQSGQFVLYAGRIRRGGISCSTDPSTKSIEAPLYSSSEPSPVRQVLLELTSCTCLLNVGSPADLHGGNSTAPLRGSWLSTGLHHSSGRHPPPLQLDDGKRVPCSKNPLQQCTDWCFLELMVGQLYFPP